MFCIDCGGPLSETDDFCTNCGRRASRLVPSSRHLVMAETIDYFAKIAGNVDEPIDVAASSLRAAQSILSDPVREVSPPILTSIEAAFRNLAKSLGVRSSTEYESIFEFLNEAAKASINSPRIRAALPFSVNESGIRLSRMIRDAISPSSNALQTIDVYFKRPGRKPERLFHVAPIMGKSQITMIGQYADQTNYRKQLELAPTTANDFDPKILHTDNGAIANFLQIERHQFLFDLFICNIVDQYPQGDWSIEGYSPAFSGGDEYSNAGGKSIMGKQSFTAPQGKRSQENPTTKAEINCLQTFAAIAGLIWVAGKFLNIW